MNLQWAGDGRKLPPIADLRAYGGEVTTKLGVTIADFRSRKDDPGQQIHGLFTELYLHDHIHWKAWLDQHVDDGFFYLFMERFHKAYDRHIASLDGRNSDPMSPGWTLYGWLAARGTMQSSIWMHLLIVIVATRAHVQDDIGDALIETAQSWYERFGYWPDITEKERIFFMASHGELFCTIALDFIHRQRDDQSGYRRFLLSVFATLLPTTKFLWWPVLNGWRQRSWVRGKAAAQAMRVDFPDQNSDHDLAMS